MIVKLFSREQRQGVNGREPGKPLTLVVGVFDGALASLPGETLHLYRVTEMPGGDLYLEKISQSKTDRFESLPDRTRTDGALKE